MSFFQVVDNTNYVKINYISDDLEAMRMNEAGRYLPDAPAVTSPCLMGGYTYPILKALAGDRTFQILKAEIPTDGSVKHVKFLEKLAAFKETIYAYVDGNEMTIVQIEGYDRSATPLSQYGWSINAAAKTFKRLKTLNRPFRLWAELDRPIRVFLVEDDSYSDEDLEGLSPELIERLLDGAFVISRELFTSCLGNVYFPEIQQENIAPELMVDYYRSQEYLRQAQFFHAFNARIFGPMDFGSLDHDDELWTRPGMLKGEAFINVAGMCEKMHVDVICTRSALKFEVANTEQTFVLLEPQKAKRTGVNSDLQTMINLPAVYDFEDVSRWTKEDLLAKFHKLNTNQIMESWYDLSTPFFNSSSRFFTQDDVTTMTKWNARAWLMSGRKITESPWLYEQMGYAIAKGLQSKDNKKLRFPVPCAARAQVISQSMASMAGDDYAIERGTARWSEPLEAIVVNDRDWIEMYHSHGGHDLDDFFVAYWRRISGERKIILVRSPNDWGEYSVMDYYDGDWFPEFETHLGEVYSFPEVSDEPTLWPIRLSEMLEQGKIIYTGLPSQNNPPPKMDAEPYALKHVMQLIENNRASSVCVGANVNARSLHALCVRDHRSVQLTTMETCIDTGTQGGSLEDAEAVMAEARDMVAKIVRDPNIKIDEYMWYSRFAQFNDMPLDKSRLDPNTHISRANKYRIDAAQNFIKMIREHARKLIPNVDPQVHRLGLRFLRPAYNVLIETRLSMVRMQEPGEQGLVPRDWSDVHAPALNAINKFEKIVDRHDFVLALYSATLKVPTRSTGKITDQLVMNPHIFPYLLNAMRFYGLAYYIDITPEGKIERSKSTEWDLECACCGDTKTVTDPKTVQAYYHYDQICKPCRIMLQEQAAQAE
jgi:hypothetical protein